MTAASCVVVLINLVLQYVAQLVNKGFHHRLKGV